MTDRRVYLAVAALLVAASFLLRGSPWLSDSGFHTQLEITATLIAGVVGVVALVRYYTAKTNALLFVAVGFLGTSLLDGYHATVTSDFFARYSPSDLRSLIPWSWFASRVFLSLLMLLSWRASRRDTRSEEPIKISERGTYLAIGALALATFAFFAFVPLPRAYYPEFIFHRPEEFLPALLFLVPLLGFSRRGDWRREPFEGWLILSLIVGFAGQALFMSFSGQLFDAMFDAAHILKILSYGCVFVGLLANVFYLFTRAEQNANDLAGALVQRERTEEALRSSEAKFKSLFEQSIDAIYLTSTDGEFVDTNEAMFELCGYTRDELSGLHARDLYANPEHRKANQRLLAETGYVKDYPILLRRKDGMTVEALDTTVARRDPDGGIIGYQGILRDVTEKKKLEQQFLQSQKMEVVGQLGGGVAHDFNNVLTGIIGYTELALAQLPPDSAAARDLEQVLASAHQAARVTQQILAFSRKQPLNREVVNLNSIVTAASKLLDTMVGETVQLELVEGSDLGATLADDAQITQVLMNLALNAIQAMPDGGTLTIETKEVDATEKTARRDPRLAGRCFVSMSVRDTGCGISSTMRDQVFDPFFTTKSVGAGTGLGLSVVLGIVENHGGVILVDSEVGKGSCFQVFLPRTEEQAGRSDGEGDSAASPRGTETILLVEDETSVRTMATRALEDMGYTVLAASHPDDALAAYASNGGDVSLLVTDVIMPGFDGPELCRRLHEKQPELKVLYISGHLGEIAHPDKLRTKQSSFLPKPFRPAKLARAVRKLLDEGGQA